MLHLTEINNAAELFALEAEWRGLWNRCPSATPFQSPDWLIPWVRWLWGGGRLVAIVLRDRGSLVALAPFFIWGNCENRKLSLLGSGISDYLDITVDPAYAEEAARLVLNHLAEEIAEWDIADLEELPADSPLIPAAAAAGLTAFSTPCSVCPVLSLPGAIDTFLSHLPAKFRANLRRREAILRSQRVELITAGPENTAELMRTLFDLHAARWQEKQHEEGVLWSPPLQNFHLDVACRFANCNMLRLYGLRIDGAWIGVQYNLAAGRRYYFYLPGFDPRWKHCSPGSQLILETIGKAIEEGALELDFLRNPEPYKYSWGARDRTNYRLLVYRSGRDRPLITGPGFERARPVESASRC